MDELTTEFVAEAAESLGALDNELVKLEQNPNDAQILGGVFRLVHTIKGTCGFLGLDRLEALTHAAENVLADIRAGGLTPTPEAISLILQTLDCIKIILTSLEESGEEPSGDDAGLIRALSTLAGHTPDIETADVDAEAEAAPRAASTDDMIDLGSPSIEGPEFAVPEAADTCAPTADVPPAIAPKPPAEMKAAAQNVRVAVQVLEDLMNMISELVVTRNQLLQAQRVSSDGAFAAPMQRLDHITSALYEGVVKTRMQPIGVAWRTFPRVVRDLAHDLGKRIELQMIGDETEIDRQVLEMIRDPLLHMVRNSCDHGLETPEQRTTAGKGDVGRITLHAFHEAGQVVIRIADDGRGLAADRIAEAAVAKGLLTAAEAGRLPSSEIQEFIFRPGFSTASTVTNVSGRGVGMDVVRNNVESHGGSLDVHSVEGVGSTFTIRFPLTLAVVPALIVAVDGNRFAIPQANIVEVARAGLNHDRPIELAGAAPVLRLRDRLLPLSHLAADLGFDAPPAATANSVYVVVCEIEAERFGVVVDQVFDTEEIVVKPVAPIMREKAMFLGNAVLGDGDVAMILDPNRLYGCLTTAATGMDLTSAPATDATTDDAAENAALLVFIAGDGPAKAAPLSRVARLEDVAPERIVMANGATVLQYRGDLLPLAILDDADDDSARPAIIFHDGVRQAAVIVNEIIDIIDAPFAIKLAGDTPGSLGLIEIDGTPFDAFDIDHHMLAICPEWRPEGAEITKRRNAVLVVDDSPFFRHLLSPLLKEAGYDVTTASNAANALALKNAGRNFDLILSEIALSGMNGFDFAGEVKASPEWSATPIVAMCASVASARRDARPDAGFEAFAGKTDRDSLLKSMAEALEVVGDAR